MSAHTNLRLESELDTCYRDAAASTYFRRLREHPNEMRAKGYDPKGPPLPAQLTRRCRALTPAQLGVAQRVLDKAAPLLASFFPGLDSTPPTALNVVVIRDKHVRRDRPSDETNCSFTLGRTIVLTPAHYPDTIVHETVHCLQTRFPQVAHRLYTGQGWVRLDQDVELALPHYIDNPDATLSRPGCFYARQGRLVYYYGLGMKVYAHDLATGSSYTVDPRERLSFLGCSFRPNQPHELLAEMVDRSYHR